LRKFDQVEPCDTIPDVAQKVEIFVFDIKDYGLNLLHLINLIKVNHGLILKIDVDAILVIGHHIPCLVEI
jgi:hypothetical protein